MTRRLTTKDFIRKAIEVHGRIYDYSEVIYTHSVEKVRISCKEHGIFNQVAAIHLQGSGCPTCGCVAAAAKRQEIVSAKATRNSEDFIKQAKARHGNSYDYSKTQYKNSKTDVIITCRKHGDFPQKPPTHLDGGGCPACGRERTTASKVGKKKGFNKRTTSSFIEESNEIHQNRYEYSKTVFVATNKKVIITCKEHGDFDQLASDHLRGRGCQKCGRKTQGLAKRISFQEWVETARERHGDTYKYDESSFTTTKHDIRIFCEKHGWFKQNAGRHAYVGHGCEECGNGRIAISRGRTTEDFIQISKEVHGNRYEYSLLKTDPETGSLIYEDNDKIRLICRDHGPFLIITNNHIHLEQGCPACEATKGEVRVRRFLEEKGIEFVYQWTDHDCIDTQKLRFDFYLPKLAVTIEYDGEQHFKPIRFNNSSSDEEIETKFQDTLRRDSIKNEWCKNNNIRMIRIPYAEDVETVLSKELLYMDYLQY